MQAAFYSPPQRIVEATLSLRYIYVSQLGLWYSLEKKQPARRHRQQLRRSWTSGPWLARGTAVPRRRHARAARPAAPAPAPRTPTAPDPEPRPDRTNTHPSQRRKAPCKKMRAEGRLWRTCRGVMVLGVSAPCSARCFSSTSFGQRCSRYRNSLRPPPPPSAAQGLANKENERCGAGTYACLPAGVARNLSAIATKGGEASSPSIATTSTGACSGGKMHG